MIDYDLLIHVPSLFLFSNSLDERIHAALDAGLDGVEISHGPGIMNWEPNRETVRRLQGVTVTIHAELYPQQGITLEKWAEKASRLPLTFANAVFHPDELQAEDFNKLSSLPFPTGIENMDSHRLDWRLPREMRLPQGVGLVLDTAHAEENGLLPRAFWAMFPPVEIHLSRAILGHDYRHAPMYQYPGYFPQLPRCPLVTLEGVILPGCLEDEVRFVRERLAQKEAWLK